MVVGSSPQSTAAAAVVDKISVINVYVWCSVSPQLVMVMMAVVVVVPNLLTNMAELNVQGRQLCR